MRYIKTLIPKDLFFEEFINTPITEYKPQEMTPKELEELREEFDGLTRTFLIEENPDKQIETNEDWIQYREYEYPDPELRSSVEWFISRHIQHEAELT